jgi:two-component system, OmpR family, sensor histidine kinase TctE
MNQDLPRAVNLDLPRAVNKDWSIRRRILAWFFVSMALVFAANMVATYYRYSEAADTAFDRLLFASASSMTEHIGMAGGKLHVDIPYIALDMLASTAHDKVFYAVTGPDGKVVTGYEGIPAPRIQTGGGRASVSYYNGTYKGAFVRIVALKSFVLSREVSGYATITVAQTRGDRDELVFSLMRQSALWMLVISMVGAITAWLGVSLGLRPLDKLRASLGKRSPDDVSPVVNDVPNEFRPLVVAINSMLKRIDVGLQSMQSFVSDASHQLKTPLASLLVQSEMALRETERDSIRSALEKVNLSVRRTSRLAQQLLSHARVTQGGRQFAPVDLAVLVRDTINLVLVYAHSKEIDLGYEGPDSVMMNGDRVQLGELILNLVDNAMKYSPIGSVVTVSVEQLEHSVCLTVVDDGPGIPVEERDSVFERFVRKDTTGADGVGLGLSIVSAAVNGHDATINLSDAPEGGLKVDVDFPGESTSKSTSKSTGTPNEGDLT